MKNLMPLRIALLLGISSFGCQIEKQPSSKTDAERSADAQAFGSKAGSAPNETIAASSETIVETETVLASESELRQGFTSEILLASRKICANERALREFATEMAVICSNGQATSVFGDLINRANLTAKPAPMVIKSESIAEVSQFMFAASFIVAAPFEATLLKRADLNTFTSTVDGVRMRETQVTTIPGDGLRTLGGFEIRQETSVSTLLGTADFTKIVTRDYVPIESNKIVAVYSSLKVGAPENADSILSNRISFWIKEGQNTRILIVSQGKTNDNGQPENVEKTALNLANQFLTNNLRILSPLPATAPAAP